MTGTSRGGGMTAKDIKALRAEYEGLEDGIDLAGWPLGDWLADNTVGGDEGGRPPKNHDPEIAVSLKIATVAEWSAERAKRTGGSPRGKTWLGRLRKVALDTRGNRRPGVPPRVYQAALAGGKTVAQANAAIDRKGGRLRDHAETMESADAALTAAKSRTPAERSRIARELVKDMKPGEKAELAADMLDDEETQVEATKLPRSQRDSIQKAAEVSPEFAEKAEVARKRIDKERKERHSLRYIEADGLIVDGTAKWRKALDVVRGVEFDDEEIDLLQHDVNKARAILGLFEMAATGEANVDWDDELTKMGG